jgi:hypothetical protein
VFLASVEEMVGNHWPDALVKISTYKEEFVAMESQTQRNESQIACSQKIH